MSDGEWQCRACDERLSFVGREVRMVVRFDYGMPEGDCACNSCVTGLEPDGDHDCSSDRANDGNHLRWVCPSCENSSEELEEIAHYVTEDEDEEDEDEDAGLTDAQRERNQRLREKGLR